MPATSHLRFVVSVNILICDYDAKGTIDLGDHFVSFAVSYLRKFQSVLVK